MIYRRCCDWRESNSRQFHASMQRLDAALRERHGKFQLFATKEERLPEKTGVNRDFPHYQQKSDDDEK